jgi:prevent-host-death family protein
MRKFFHRTIDMANNMANIGPMKTANIAEFKNSLSQFIADVERGEEIEIRRRNLPIARVVPIPAGRQNETKLGLGQGTAKVRGDLTEPLIPETHWEMLENDES